MAMPRRTTDFGTVVLHAVLVVTFGITLATGLRIATDDPDLEWLVVFDPVLPIENLFWTHLVAGTAMMATFAGYVVYIRRARLQARTRVDKGRLLAIFSSGSNRWAGLNAVVFAVLKFSLMTAVVSGLLLLSGFGGLLMVVHFDATVVSVLCAVLHVALHAAYGGWSQLIRIVRPVALTIAPEPPDLAELLAEQLAKQRALQIADKSDGSRHDRPQNGGRGVAVQAHPFAIGLAVAIVVGMFAVGAEQVTRPELVISEIDPATAPRLDGDLSDPVWTSARPEKVLTSQGGDFGGTHESNIEVRAVHDGTYAYFAIVWDDPTRSLKHMPLVKVNGRWSVAATRADLVDEKKFSEDKFAVLLTRAGLPLIGGAIHLARKPLKDEPPSVTGRGLHYTPNGGVADIWLWRASHGGLIGHVDNCYFAGAARAGPDVQRPAAAYAGGFGCESATSATQSNIAVIEGATAKGEVRPARLPINAAKLKQMLGRVSGNPHHSETEGARWWMTMSETMPYSAEADRLLPDGTVVPSILLADRLPELPNSIRGVARWSAGRWTLELARRLYTNSPNDVPIKTGALMWFAAFDHAEKRHTRHLRPFRLKVD